jgi:hypothetical protein
MRCPCHGSESIPPGGPVPLQPARRPTRCRPLGPFQHRRDAVTPAALCNRADGVMAEAAAATGPFSTLLAQSAPKFSLEVLPPPMHGRIEHYWRRASVIEEPERKQ